MKDAEDEQGGVTRRTLLRGGMVSLAVFAAGGGSALGGVAVPVDGSGPVFLSPRELETLRAVVDRIVPGRAETGDDGAVVAGCAEAIDALLGAFGVDPPRIYAGGPFSDRGGAPGNDFARFVPLDPYEAKAWRLRIEGSRGRPELEFNGPVKGLQAIYRDGLAALDRAAAPARFADLPAPARDLLLRSSTDAAVAGLVDVAAPHTLEFFYGAPEYGGNRELLGWRLTHYDGDVQPRGYTREQVESDGDAVALPLPAGLGPDDLLRLAPLVSAEVAHGTVARSAGRLSGLRAELAAIREGGVRHGR